MLGMGHDPTEVMSSMSKSHVMANVMASVCDTQTLCRHIEAKWDTPSACPFDRFMHE